MCEPDVVDRSVIGLAGRRQKWGRGPMLCGAEIVGGRGALLDVNASEPVGSTLLSNSLALVSVRGVVVGPPAKGPPSFPGLPPGEQDAPGGAEVGAIEGQK